jgi:hypothetical protein
MLKEKNCQPKILYPEKISSRNEGEVKTLLDKEKPREFITTRPTVEEWFMEIL